MKKIWVLAFLVLSSCAAPRVVGQDDTSITIRYDRWTVGGIQDRVAVLANSHCARYNKRSELSYVSHIPLDFVYKTYVCKD